MRDWIANGSKVRTIREVPDAIALGRTDTKLAEKFWWSWQMRQSLQPVVVPDVLSVVTGSETDDAPLDGMKIRPCLCAASTVVPYKMKSVNSKPTVLDTDAVLLLKVLERMLVAVRIDVLESEGCRRFELYR